MRAEAQQHLMMSSRRSWGNRGVGDSSGGCAFMKINVLEIRHALALSQ